MGEGKEREGAASPEDASNNNKIYSHIASRGTTIANAKAAKDDDDEEGRMVGILQLWVCVMGHMEAVAKLITERDIDFHKHLNGVTCPYFEDGTGFELRFTFDIKTNEYFTGGLLIKRYEVRNLLLDDEPILKDVTGCNIHWKEGRSLTYRGINKKQRSKSGGRAVQRCTVNKRERTNSFSHFFM